MRLQPAGAHRLRALKSNTLDAGAGVAATDDVLHLQFGELAQPVRMQGCARLVEQIPLVFPGWSIHRRPASRLAPVLSVSREKGAYCFRGYWLSETLRRRDEPAALSALAAEVVRAWVRADDNMLCLHGAAADFGGRLVVFPNRYRSGKSLLSACLAAEGVPLFGDDVLPIGIDDARAIAPGLAPRLRLPIPTNLVATARRYIEQRSALRGERYLYLDLAGEHLAERGSKASIGAFVLLHRETGARAAIEPITAAEVLKQVVWQNFARKADAPRILDVLSGIVAGAHRYRLRYDLACDAVELLRQTFAEWPAAPETATAGARAGAEVSANDVAMPPGRIFVRGDIHMVSLDGECFLADDRGHAIHHLNPVGSAIWSLLSKAVSIDEILDLLHAAFPDSDRGALRRDLREMLAILRAKDLLDTNDDPAGLVPRVRAE